jgi:hypothetical protein
MGETVAGDALRQIGRGMQVATEAELAVYAAEFSCTGFQGGLQAYRCVFDAKQIAELRLFSGRTIDVPSVFIAGKSNWGPYQTPVRLRQ